MHQLIRRIVLLEALYQPQEGRRCLLVHRYQGETTAEAIQAEGAVLADPQQLVLVFRRDACTREAAPGAHA